MKSFISIFHRKNYDFYNSLNDSFVIVYRSYFISGMWWISCQFKSRELLYTDLNSLRVLRFVHESMLQSCRNLETKSRNKIYTNTFLIVSDKDPRNLLAPRFLHRRCRSAITAQRMMCWPNTKICDASSSLISTDSSSIAHWRHISRAS